MPIKPGEFVWVMYYDPNETTGASLGPDTASIDPADFAAALRMILEQSTTGASPLVEQGYWICRVSDLEPFDDINFTVGSRKRWPSEEPGEAPVDNTAKSDEAKEDEDSDPPIGNFPRTKDGLPSSFVNGAFGESQNDVGALSFFKDVFDNSTANGIFEREVVPRYSCRPGDLVLQGSNNALICLGTDRTGPAGIYNEKTGLPFPLGGEDGPDASKLESDYVEYAGTIDMVVGRGRVLPVSAGDEPGADDTSPTAPKVTATDAKARGTVMEVDKNPTIVDNGDPNLLEGDPDFARDASRLYLSMRTDADRNFGSVEVKGLFPIPYPEPTDNSPKDDFYARDDDFVNPVPAKPAKDDTVPVASAFAVLKSDEIRIVARKSEKPAINGSIKIVKEGKQGEDLACIIMHPDGTIHIDAPKIILGRNDAKLQKDVKVGEDAGTGFVKFSQYNVQMAALHDQLTTLAIAVEDGLNELDARTKDIRGALSTKTNAPGMGAPVPGLMATALTWNGSWSTWLGLGTDPPGMAMNVQGDSGGDDKSSMTAGGEDLKSNIPDARSETIFGE
jgi:hypothetical protein